MGEMFVTFSTFVTDYRKAELYLQKKVETEEKNRKRKIADEMRKAAQASKKQALTREGTQTMLLDDQKMPVSPTTPEEKKNELIVDKVVGALQGDAGSIRQLIRARRRKAGAGRAGRRQSGIVTEGLTNEKHKQSLPDLSEDSGTNTSLNNGLRSLKTSNITKSPMSSASAPGSPTRVPTTQVNNNAPKQAKRKKKPLWQAILDPDSNETYYYNTKTGESVWDKPSNFPY